MRRRAFLFAAALTALPGRVRSLLASTCAEAPPRPKVLLWLNVPGNHFYAVTRSGEDPNIVLMCSTVEGEERWRRRLSFTTVRSLGRRCYGTVFVTGVHRGSDMLLVEYGMDGVLVKKQPFCN